MVESTKASDGAAVPMTSAAGPMIRQIETCLDAVCGPKVRAPWAFLDWPSHSNVGDSAIWLGTLALLERRFGGAPAYVTRSLDFPADLDRVMPEGTIYLCGGGNFGDLWQGLQENRIRLLRAFPHRKIVQLPQSIHFSTPEAADDTARAIAQHPDFTLLVRDRASLDFARQRFECPLHLCPDLAYGLERLTSRIEPEAPVFSLMRVDLEKRTGGPDAAAAARFGPVADWITDHSRLLRADRAVVSLCRRIPALRGHLMARLEGVFRRQALRELQRGADMLARGQVVLTDRLHGHILCALMGKRHVTFDNSYGKLSGFINSWPADGLTRQASGIDDVEQILREWADRGGAARD